MTTNSPIQTLPRRQAWNPAGDFYEGLSGFVGSGNRYGYWLPSNIPNVYAATTFGITNTGSTSYPTGTQSIGGTTGGTAFTSNVFYFSFVPIASYTITAIGVNVQSVAGDVETAIYGDSSGPSSLLAYSSSTIASIGWMDLPLNVPVYVTSGTQYWLALEFSSSSSKGYFQNIASSTRYIQSSTYGPFPATASGTKGSGNVSYANMRVTYVQIEGYTQGTRVQYTDVTGETVSSFAFYVSTYNSGDKIVLALYSDSSGSPNQLLWSSSTSGTDPGSTGWYTINEPSGTTYNSWGGILVNGDHYWFVWQWNSVDAGPSYVSGGSNTGIYLAQSFGTLSSTWSGGTLSTENWSMYLTYAPSTTSTTSISTTSTTSISTTSTTSISTTSTTSTSTTQSITPSQVKDCTYLIFTDGTNTYMQDCNTSEILLYSTSASTVISDAVANLTSGGLLFIRAGTYTISQQINVLVSNITIAGEGWGTILKEAPNMVGSISGQPSSHLLYFLNVNNVIVRDLAIDGNRASQSAACEHPQCIGIEADLSSYVVFEDLYVHDVKTVGMVFEGAVHSSMIEDIVANCNANGLSIGPYTLTQPSQWDKVIGTTVLTASDVGISIDALDILVQDNTVRNVTLNESPFGNNSHVGIYVGDNQNATRITVQGNQLYEIGDYGIVVTADGGPSLDTKNIVVEGNQLVDCSGGIYVAYSKGVNIANNMIQSTTSSTESGIKLYTGALDVDVDDNTLNDTRFTGIMSQANAAAITGNDVTETNNHIVGSNAIEIYAGNNTVSNNLLDFSAVTVPNYEAAYIDPGASGTVFTGNVILGNVNIALTGTGISWGGTDTFISENKIGGFATCLNAGDTPVQGAVVENVLSKCTTSITWSSGSTFSIFGNIGYNPVGHLASPWDATHDRISDTGGITAPPNATTMTVNNSPKLVIVVVGSGWTSAHTLVIKIDGAQIISTNTPATNAVYSFALSYGQTFYCQYQSGQVTFIVSGQ